MQQETPLRFIRRAVFNTTQDELAAIGGVNRSRISRYESGDENPSFRFLLRLRAEARSRGIPFSAEWFFEVPVERREVA